MVRVMVDGVVPPGAEAALAHSLQQTVQGRSGSSGLLAGGCWGAGWQWIGAGGSNGWSGVGCMWMLLDAGDCRYFKWLDVVFGGLRVGV